MKKLQRKDAVTLKRIMLCMKPSVPKQMYTWWYV